MQKLTEHSALLIDIMFLEPAVMKELIDSSENNLYSKVSVDTDRCEIILGKTRFTWWNQLIGAERRISLAEFAFKVVSVLTAKAEKDKNSHIIGKGLLEDIADALNREGRSNDIIDRLFLVGYLGVKTAWSCSSFSAGAEQSKTTDVNLRINKKVHKFHLPGSNEDVISVEIGPTGVAWIGDE